MDVFASIGERPEVSVSDEQAVRWNGGCGQGGLLPNSGKKFGATLRLGLPGFDEVNTGGQQNKLTGFGVIQGNFKDAISAFFAAGINVTGWNAVEGYLINADRDISGSQFHQGHAARNITKCRMQKPVVDIVQIGGLKLQVLQCDCFGAVEL